jgi:uncharacterized RDD family membrane protein YckC
VIELEASAAPDDARCAVHPEIAALFVCSRCGDFCCEQCVASLGGRAVCPRCGASIFGPAGAMDRVFAGIVDYAVPILIPLLGWLIPVAIDIRDVTLVVGLTGTLIGLGIVILNAILVLSRAATLGRHFRGITVARVDGSRPTLVQCVGLRFGAVTAVLVGASWVSLWLAIVLVVVNIWLMAKTGRSAVDRISKTIVITVPRHLGDRAGRLKSD